VRYYNEVWASTPHRDVCVQLKAGTVVVSVAGTPQFDIFYAPPTVYVGGLEVPGKITLATPDDPHNRGMVCVRIATN